MEIVDPHKWRKQTHCSLWPKGSLAVFTAEICFLNYRKKSKNCKKERLVSYCLERSFQSRGKLIGHGHFPVFSVKRKAMYRQAEHYKILLVLPHASVISLCFLMQKVFIPLHKVEKYCKGPWLLLIRKARAISSALW